MRPFFLRLQVSAAAFAFLYLGACTHAPPTKTYSNETLQANEALRLELAQLTRSLGDPLPPPDPEDPLGVEDLPNLSQRAFIKGESRMAEAPIKTRLTGWKNRVHTVEITFPKGCPPRCAALFFSTFNQWLAAPPPTAQGNAQTQTVQHDTVQLTFEWYPKKTEVSRLLIQCQPLYAAAHHRPSRLPGVGQRVAVQRLPQCRPLMP